MQFFLLRIYSPSVCVRKSTKPSAYCFTDTHTAYTPLTRRSRMNYNTPRALELWAFVFMSIWPAGTFVDRSPGNIHIHNAFANPYAVFALTHRRPTIAASISPAPQFLTTSCVISQVTFMSWCMTVYAIRT